jgi:hypothetical protein
VNSVALIEDIGFHLGVPTLRLMTEVETCIKEILKSKACKGRSWHIHFICPFKLGEGFYIFSAIG